MNDSNDFDLESKFDLEFDVGSWISRRIRMTHPHGVGPGTSRTYTSWAVAAHLPCMVCILQYKADLYHCISICSCIDIQWCIIDLLYLLCTYNINCLIKKWECMIPVSLLDYYLPCIPCGIMHVQGFPWAAADDEYVLNKYRFCKNLISTAWIFWPQFNLGPRYPVDYIYL